MNAPKMPEIRQTIARARAMAGLEDTETFTLEAPHLLAQLVRILDLYVGHEPTLAEEDAYARAENQRKDDAIAEALRLLESAPEAFLGASQNITAAVHALRQASPDTACTATQPAFFLPGRTYTYGGDGFTAPELLTWFRVEHITTHPESGKRAAFGWARRGGESWVPYSEPADDFADFTEVATYADTRGEPGGDH